MAGAKGRSGILIRGVDIELHPPGDYVSDTIRETREFYEADILDEIRRRLTKRGVIVDVGAMIGNHTAYFVAFVPHTRIHAFEPLPANVALLRRNVRRYPTVSVHEVALSDRRGRLSMAVEDNLGHARVAPDGVEVDARTLDGCGFADVTLIKIDVEGHEAEVLAGAAATIARCRPLICIEDWRHPRLGALLPGYRLVAEWEQAHQTFLYEPA